MREGRDQEGTDGEVKDCKWLWPMRHVPEPTWDSYGDAGCPLHRGFLSFP
jgi:hypothetical protein